MLVKDKVFFNSPNVEVALDIPNLPGISSFMPRRSFNIERANCIPF